MFKLVFNAAEQINTHTIIHVPYKKMFNKLLHGLGIIEFNLKKKIIFQHSACRKYFSSIVWHTCYSNSAAKMVKNLRRATFLSIRVVRKYTVIITC